MSAAVGIAIQRIGLVRPPRRASLPICRASSLRFAARARRVPKNGITAGETTASAPGGRGGESAGERRLVTIAGSTSLFERLGKPIQIEFKKITRGPASAKRLNKEIFPDRR